MLNVEQALVVVLMTCKHRVDHCLFYPCQEDGRIRNHLGDVGADGTHVNSVHPRIGGAAEWGWCEEGVKLSGHHHTLPPAEGALGAGEML